MAENFTAVDPSVSGKSVPDIWERLADGDGAAISLLIEEIRERKTLMKTLFEGTGRMETIITRELSMAKMEPSVCQKKIIAVEGKVSHYFKALEQTETAEKLITAKFLKKFKLKDLVEEEEVDEGCGGSEEKADGNVDEGEAAPSSSSSSSSSSAAVVTVLQDSIALSRQPRLATCWGNRDPNYLDPEEAIFTPVDEVADIQNGGGLEDDVDRAGDTQLDEAAHNSAVKLAAEQVADSQASEYVPLDSQDSSSSDESEEVDWTALSQEFVESDDSPEVKTKKRDKDGAIKVTSLVAKKRLDLEGQEIASADVAPIPAGSSAVGVGAAVASGGGGAAVIDDPRMDPYMPVLSKNGAIPFGMFTVWRQVRMGMNPPADGETCSALREYLLKLGMKPKTKATKSELVVWVKKCWRVWRKYLLWKRSVFKHDPRKLELDDQLRIA